MILAGFIEEVHYPTWLANIVHVWKDKQIRVCIDFQDLNKTCPNVDFSSSFTEIMIDATTRHVALSFIDGSYKYNQIKMTPDYAVHTSFQTPKGIFYCKVMSFGLKIAGATYQRTMTIIFGDVLHKVVKCYVDDLVIKTVNIKDYLHSFDIVFEPSIEVSVSMPVHVRHDILGMPSRVGTRHASPQWPARIGTPPRLRHVT